MSAPMGSLPRLRSHIAGAWVDGTGAVSTLIDPSTEAPVAELASGVDVAVALTYARTIGGPALRTLTYKQRGELCGSLAKLIHERRDELIGLAMANGGNTRGDAKFDIDGASGTLQSYAELGASLGDVTLLADGDAIQLGRAPRVAGQHVYAPRRGVAVHINAFNFPAWGTAEKLACSLVAGVPVISKPATATAHVAHRIVELAVEAKLLPAGAVQLLLGSVGDLLDRLAPEDVLAFTGSGDTAAKLRGHEAFVRRGTRINVEADSLNSVVLGPDVEPGTPTWDLFVNEIAKDITQKTGQKCTAVRRVIAPAARMSDVEEVLREKLGAVKVGDPRQDDVTMGPLATAEQKKSVTAGVKLLAGESRVVFEGSAPSGKGFFQAPVLLRQDEPAKAKAVHAHEVFGPVSTLMPHAGADDAAAIVARGEGSLVVSIYADDRAFLGAAIAAIAPTTGRVYVGSAKVAGQTFGPGTVLPTLVHGGPGRAGSGEELGGRRGLALYQQRTALQGDRALLDALVGRTAT